MAVPGELRTAAIVILSVLLVVTAILVPTFGWLPTGHVVFGFAVGMMVGMSQSAVISGVLPLLFAFAGGSIVALSVAEDRTAAQLDILGRQLAGFSIGTVIGLLAGIILTKIDVKLPLGKFRE